MDLVYQNKYHVLLGTLTYSSFLPRNCLINFPMSTLFESMIIGGTGVYFLSLLLPSRFCAPLYLALFTTIGINFFNKIPSHIFRQPAQTNPC